MMTVVTTISISERKMEMVARLRIEQHPSTCVGNGPSLRAQRMGPLPLAAAGHMARHGWTAGRGMRVAAEKQLRIFGHVP